MKKSITLTLLYIINILIILPYVFNHIYAWLSPILFVITTYYYISFIYKFFKQLNKQSNEKN